MLLYLALGAAVLWFLLGLGRSGKVLKRREWRFLSAASSIALFAAGAFVAMRGEWPVAIVLVVVGLWLVTTSRLNAPRPAQPPPRSSEMSLSEARSILGVGPDATEDEIQAAYGRLIRMAHPDKGGTSGLAAQLNAARDRLLGQ